MIFIDKGSSMKKWSEKEINFLKENYFNGDLSYISEETGHSVNSVCSKAYSIGLTRINRLEKYDYENFNKIISESKSINDCLYKLGMTRTGDNQITIKKYIRLYNIDTSHFLINKNVKEKYIKLKLIDILKEKSTYNRTLLKQRLYNEGLKERKCELCGQSEEWNGKHMSLILDHINGINDDNRIENLRIVCPNCNATLDTHCGKNKKKFKAPKEKKNNTD